MTQRRKRLFLSRINYRMWAAKSTVGDDLQWPLKLTSVSFACHVDTINGLKLNVVKWHSVKEQEEEDDNDEEEEEEFITQRCSVAKRVGCFQRRLFVCLFVNAITSERVNIGWWNLGVSALYKISAEFEFGGHTLPPWVRTLTTWRWATT